MFNMKHFIHIMMINAMLIISSACPIAAHAQDTAIPKFGIFERTFTHISTCANPYTYITAKAHLTEPDRKTRRILPLFWDGDTTWRFRFSPDKVGDWQWAVRSDDPGLNGNSGSFHVIESQNKGGILPMKQHPYHFERQNSEPFWLMGDTAWSLYTNSKSEKHDRAAVEKYIDARARQGFNAVHSMLLSTSGWGNCNGMPFKNISKEQINPSYWQEVDERLSYLNSRGITGGLALAWGCKIGTERFPWRAFPSIVARKRYARYIAARYSAFNVYFIVSGEWHGEVQTRYGAKEEQIREEFITLGKVLRQSDPHRRMIAIHPMTKNGSVREFARAAWMSFGDYQQNYRDLHGRMLLSHRFDRPVVNAEYAYYLRDRTGDGKCDKPNSTTLDAIRHATWDIVMAGGYFITGFGSTYFGGNRNPGPFNVDDPRNDDWIRQVQYVKKFFTGLEWWKLDPHDELLKAGVSRSKDSKALGIIAPPAVAYWALAELRHHYVVYARGLRSTLKLSLGMGVKGRFNAKQFNPRTGELRDIGVCSGSSSFDYRAPDTQDWIVLLDRADTLE